MCRDWAERIRCPSYEGQHQRSPCDRDKPAAPLQRSDRSSGIRPTGQFAIYFNYPLLPWVGVLFLGYGAAGLFELPAQQRDRRLLRIGLSLVIAFLLIRVLNVYGDPKPWMVDSNNVAASVMSFLATTKYPPSLLFVLMTLGPAAILDPGGRDALSAVQMGRGGQGAATGLVAQLRVMSFASG